MTEINLDGVTFDGLGNLNEVSDFFSALYQVVDSLHPKTMQKMGAASTTTAHTSSIWSMYLNRARRLDDTFVESCREDMESLLLFVSVVGCRYCNALLNFNVVSLRSSQQLSPPSSLKATKSYSRTLQMQRRCFYFESAANSLRRAQFPAFLSYRPSHHQEQQSYTTPAGS